MQRTDGEFQHCPYLQCCNADDMLWGFEGSAVANFHVHLQLTFCNWSATPHDSGEPKEASRSASVSDAAMPTQFLLASMLSRPPSPAMASIRTMPGWSGSTVAVTMSPSPCIRYRHSQASFF